MIIVELPVGNNVVPLRSDIIWLVQNGCSFHELRFEDPNQHLKDFLKLVDSLDLDGENRKRTRMRLFQFPFRDQASNWLKRLPARSITTWDDLTTRFLAKFFPPGRTAKLRNDILMFQQHQGESLSEAWSRFKDLLQKVPYHGIDRWLQIQTFYDHVSFHLKCEIDRAASGKLHDKNADESWEIIENLALYDHEGWNDSKEFVKPVKAISTPQGTSKTPDQRLLELEDRINFLLKGSRPTPRPSSTHIPQAYAEAVYSNLRPQNQNGPPKKNSFTFHERTNPNPLPQALGTTFKARVRDYMTTHTERMERFENAIFKQQDEINDRMAEMFGLFKELTTSRAPEKVLIREKAKSIVTKNVNYISLARGEEERNENDDMAADGGINGTHMKMPVKEAEKETKAENGTKNKPIKRTKIEETTEASNSQAVEYYLKHKINEKLIEGLVDNHMFNDSLKEAIGGNFEIPCNIGGLKRMNALVDQGSDVNVMPLSTYMKLTDERPAETDIRLSLASYSYIYPLGIAEDVLVDVVGIPEPFCKVEKGIKNDFKPIAPTMTVNRLVLEWEERIRLHQENEMEFDQWRSKNFNNKHPALFKVKGEMNEGEVT
nr:zinc finger, CCHC-type [Tanacetum cinerariifolium]